MALFIRLHPKGGMSEIITPGKQFCKIMLMNSMGLNVMDRDDDFQTNQYSFTGLSEIYDAFMQDISGAAEIPATRLFGRSPAGMNATGESDLINYYDKIAQLQESKMRPMLEKLLPILCMSVFGEVPDDIEIEFNPVAETSEEQRANLIQQSSSAILSVFQGGLISQRTALKELRQSGTALNMWNNITDEDIENAESDVMSGEQESDMSAMMAGMGNLPTDEENAGNEAQEASGEQVEGVEANESTGQSDNAASAENKSSRRAADSHWWRRNKR